MRDYEHEVRVRIVFETGTDPLLQTPGAPKGTSRQRSRLGPSWAPAPVVSMANQAVASAAICHFATNDEK